MHVMPPDVLLFGSLDPLVHQVFYDDDDDDDV
jgi:hypothetical protein